MLKGKSAIVTGSTSGIGEGIAMALAAEGVNILLNGFGDAAAIEKQRADMAEKYGVKVEYSAADMSKPDDIYAMVRQAETAFGAVDILVNNAGIQTVSPIESFPDDKFEQIVKINMMASWYATKAVFAGMKQRKWGRIVNIASAHGVVGSANKSAYVMAKHGVVGLTRSVAMEGGAYGITINAICPGYVNTPLVQKQIPEQAKANNMSEAEVVQKVLLAEHAVKEFVEVSQIAALAVLLCSDAGQTITGSAQMIDAGWTAH